MPLSARQHHRFFLRHGLQSRAGHTHKHLAGGGNGVDVGTGTGEHHTGAAQVPVHLLRALLELLKAVAAAGNQNVNAGVGSIQLGSQFNELPGRVAGRLIQSADVADHHAVPQVKLLPHRFPGYVRREFIGIDPVDGEGNVLSRHTVLPHQIVPDVFAHCQGTFAPVGQQLEHAADLKDAVAGCDKGKLQTALQGTAQKGGDAGMGMDDIRLLLAQDVLKQSAGAHHVLHTAPVHGHIVVPDPRGSHLRDIHSPVGGDHHLMSSGLQFLGQLHDMGLGSADIQPHGRHENLHGQLLLPGLSPPAGPLQC